MVAQDATQELVRQLKLNHLLYQLSLQVKH